MRIAVLGGGHGAYAAAADLVERGHALRWWRRDAAAFGALEARGSLSLRDADGVREVAPARLCADIGEAVLGAELIVLPLPAFAQEPIARALAPHLTGGQVLFLPPGSFGAYAMARALRDAGSRAEVTLAETGTLPYLARKRSESEVAITMRAKRLPTGAFPARRSAHALAAIGAAFPGIEPLEDALSAALMNAGPIIHPPLILMNAGPLQFFAGGGARALRGSVTGDAPAADGGLRAHGGPAAAPGAWDIHAEGTQPAIRRVTDRLDAERIALREALGYAAPHFPLRDHYESDRWMYGDAHHRLVESGDWREPIDLATHRYLREDVQYGLAFLASVAAWAGVGAPLASGLLALAGAALGEDFRAGPRTLEALGLAALSRGALRALLRDGLA